MENEEKGYNYKEAINKTTDFLKGFPLPKKPSDFGVEYDFPEDVQGVTSTDLGRWLFRLAGWKGYTLRLLASEEVGLCIATETYNTEILKGISIEDTGKKSTKDSIIGKLLLEQPKLKKLKLENAERTSQVAALKRIVDIYTIQLEIISREISRRAIELKHSQIGGSF